ncbi:MAG: hypothetical protein K8R58_11555, partial [Bacteroidales bacterium]|nr:hypothetical protein [Bacteroidales bacterium]
EDAVTFELAAIEQQKKALNIYMNENPDAVTIAQRLDNNIYTIEILSEIIKKEIVSSEQIQGEQKVISFSDILINPELPKGLIYKVQITAINRPVTLNYFKGIEPISAEKSSGYEYTKYMAGIFSNFDQALEARNKIRSLDFKEAFVVAYYDGNRITEDEALALIAKDVPVNNPNIHTNFAITSKAGIPVSTSMSIGNNVSDIKGLFYSVQLGIYSDPKTPGQLLNIEPLYYERTSGGKWKYMTGLYQTQNQAQIAKADIIVKGITDAFIVAYNNGIRIDIRQENIQEEVEVQKTTATATNQENLSRIKSEVIEFKVQLGAFREEKSPEWFDDLFRKVRHEIEIHETTGGITIYTTGSFKDYNSAVEYKNYLINEGITDAFVVAYQGNKKISLQNALKLFRSTNK